ncbi:sulfatase-like hydrolase/transferase [Pontibacter sp. G13]|uniref:sulfatase-like hydrolase/transferase n=1 Tax=Pontibacter sp. G13 TaxID=3074898 RepID=UPI002889EB85|nr:sulfatase-like hydrolase/transferase [Pontibacter sp. G13]WNJ20637.1 sulfatase-like hydrolase/transferase [Pontibacter sp. G13]
MKHQSYFLAIIGACLLMWNSSILRVRAQTPPNVVLILVDDLGYADFGCYGSEIHTPTMDSLAAQGLRYRRFYNAARCSPTRCALLTGLYTHQVAVNPAQSLPNLRTDNNLTLAELLSANGYRTYLSGKWHLGKLNTLRDPFNRGFQHGFGMGNNVDGANIKSFWDINEYGLKSLNNEIPWDPYTGTQFYQTDAIGDYSVDFIQHHNGKNDNKPFFLYMAFNATHWPIHAPADVADKYTDVGDSDTADVDVFRYEVGWDSTRRFRMNKQLAIGAITGEYEMSERGDAVAPAQTPIPAWETLDLKRQKDQVRRMALYAAMVEKIDDNIKKVVDLLNQTHQLDNTLIIILADNGGNYEGGLFGNPDAREESDLAVMGQPNDPASFPRVNVGSGWANVNNTPFRLYKHFVHEGGIRSPAIFFYPQGIQNPGRWEDQPTHLIDVVPTIVELIGAQYPSTFESHPVLPMEGESLIPHFQGGQIPERQIFQEHESNRALFKDNYKFVTKNFAFSDGSSPAHELELYNMGTDPCELNNLATVEPLRLQEMMIAWNTKAQEVGVPNNRLLTIVSTNLDADFEWTGIQVLGESHDLYRTLRLNQIHGQSTITLRSLAGKQISRAKIQSSLVQIPTASLGNGVYVLQVENSQKVYYAKFTVSH